MDSSEVSFLNYQHVTGPGACSSAKFMLSVSSETEKDMLYITEDLSSDMEHNAISLTQYKECPRHKPFINTEFRRSPAKSISSFPVNNRDAVVDALKNLQDKVKRLELERSTAEDSLKSLASHTSSFKDTLMKEKEVQESSQDVIYKQKQEVETQLESAEARCSLLQKQLDYMKKMLENSERDRQNTALRTVITERQMHHSVPPVIHNSRIEELERERVKLATTQTLAQKKIRDLENKLMEERRNRQFVQKRAAELETEAATNRILLNGELSCRLPEKSRKLVKKKKKKVVSSKKYPYSNNQRVEPHKHFRVNLAEIPFVAGTSTSASHAVGANVQKVIALMKTHNLALCSSLTDNGQSGSASSDSSNHSYDSDLSDLLLQLQDEFGQLSVEHQELVNQINECRDFRLREDLERELQSTVYKLEAKGLQISRIRQHQQKLQNFKSKKKKISKPVYHHKPPDRPKSAHPSFPKTRANVRSSSRERPLTSRALDVLRDMKKLQTTLRRDDIKWE
ncbi:centrosomal protein of 57 kDa-like isoform X2 [Gigantopelta aegis]|uniref:centrosomal protein of 57 kDa-like isoform X2 n=1 Tax=Gigantopelta aegis TaxID=1735272 RepID=UPI001B887E25|nr:centrosomal protein of 57 kDa-like isoform X2 [Gigantopelta aegis]